MGAALRSSPPHPLARAKALKPAPDNVVHLRSAVRKAGRLRSREIAQQSFTETRCLVVDFAEAVDVDERAASRAGPAPPGRGAVHARARASVPSLGARAAGAARWAVTMVGEEFRRTRHARYLALGKEPPHWVAPNKRFTDDELDLAAIAATGEHPLRELVEAGILPVRRAALLLKRVR